MPESTACLPPVRCKEVTCGELKGTRRCRLGLSRGNMEMMTPPTSRPVGDQGHRGRTALDACQELGAGISLPSSQSILAASPCSHLGKLTGGRRDGPSASASPSVSASRLLGLLGPCAPAGWLSTRTASCGLSAPLLQCGLHSAGLWPSPLVAAKSLCHLLKNSPPIPQRGQADRKTCHLLTDLLLSKSERKRLSHEQRRGAQLCPKVALCHPTW